MRVLGLVCVAWLVGCNEYTVQSIKEGVSVPPDTDQGPSAEPEAPSFGFHGGAHRNYWYIFDDDTPYETFSSPEFVVDHHGDPSLYWYEPSGYHALIGSSDVTADFVGLRQWVVDRAGAPIFVDRPLTFSSTSTLSTFEYATFTYILCDFWVPEGDDPSLYRFGVDHVDDGILVLLNGQFVDYLTLFQSGSWQLDVLPGQTNSVLVILVDDSADDRILEGAVLSRDGQIIQ